MPAKSYGQIAFEAWRERWNQGLIHDEDPVLKSRGMWEHQMQLTKEAWYAAATAVLEAYDSSDE